MTIEIQIERNYFSVGKFFILIGRTKVPTKIFKYRYFDISWRVVRLQLATPWFWIGVTK